MKKGNSKKEIDSSFDGFEVKIDSRTGEISHLSTGSFVGINNGSKWVYEEQVDINPHPPVDKMHTQANLRSSNKEKRPKKVRLKTIKELDHKPIDFE